MIHPTAVIEASAKLGQNVKVGAFCYIGHNVVLGDDCVLETHVAIKGPATIGKGNHFYQFASIGEACQDKKYKGEPTELIVGDYNVFREGCSVHRGTVQDQGKTIIGSHNLFMNTTHIAHDCIIGNNVIFASGAQAAGHVQVGDWAILGGMTGVHQFVHIGAHSFCGGGSIVLKDVPPYLMVHGAPCVPAGINTEGLKRRGFSSEALLEIRRAYKEVYRKGQTVPEALQALAEKSAAMPEVQAFTDFIANASRGIVR
ncbi:acyl-[acyl-carrier-protein]--UDP-N-acetylglucosamine O-acyltransferase [Alishewanella longhuensis]|uniref:Acyl-[acyl-carrier-protein]--UDP-N-acetylglucosamine O-acyltransferase n=1 Tax=Alishewanella longhuensis TaxID=1091037 RepID=A0ABQ3KW96_9ALTE|nr:acyl-ACP--UDP-N-acetylglucosamine O-acyltransferase [Alishewanella longhuensis]GHG64587.1 acyl-[acyl-carrier-protein]--UDP-N-acetylglucosamine O-acyltransferase [Alishewanella longhuensis]